jgi:cytochrome c biogenesis factor
MYPARRKGNIEFMLTRLPVTLSVTQFHITSASYTYVLLILIIFIRAESSSFSYKSFDLISGFQIFEHNWPNYDRTF